MPWPLYLVALFVLLSFAALMIVYTCVAFEGGFPNGYQTTFPCMLQFRLNPSPWLNQNKG